jgi:4-hydroxybenzoate polyprenyltransferase
LNHNPYSATEVRPKTGIPLAALLRSVRFDEVIILQGTPLMGVVFSIGAVTREKVGLVLLFTIANIVLVAHGFLFNDWAAAAQKATEPNKATTLVYGGELSSRSLFLFSVSLLIAGLALFGLLGPKCLLLAAGFALLGILYSHPRINLKSIPVASSLAHLCAGLLHFLLGYALFSRLDQRGLLIGLFFGLTFAAGHLNHEVHDYDLDRQNNIVTNAVAFGKRCVFSASFILFTLAFLCLFFLAMNGLVSHLVIFFCVVLYPMQLVFVVRAARRGLTPEVIHQFRTRYRLIYGLLGLGMLFATILPVK